MKTYPLYLNGQWVTSPDSLSVVNPAEGEDFARISTVGRERVAVAIQDAHAAFQTWRVTSGRDRGKLLHHFAEELHRRREEAARLITLENGQPLAESLAEVAMSVDHLRWFADEARRSYGRVVPPAMSNKRNWVIKQPAGVAAAITPWNSPLMLPVRKIGAALAAGCAVIHKPARQTPLSAVALAECFDAIKPPRGVFQMVVGDPEDLALEFLENPLCRRVSFTGSVRTGRRLIEEAAQQVKPLLLELGGNAPVLVFDDCDLSIAVNATLLAKFRSAGQSCIAANRIFVHRTLYPGFVQMFTDRTKGLKVGNGL